MALSRDARLAARVRRGDNAAFEKLYARHQPAILSFCRHLTGNAEDAEDAVQHTFLAAYRRIEESDADLELRPWLFTVARNRCLSLLRARRDGVVADPDAVGFTFDGLSAQVERRQELRDLVLDLGRLPEPQRAALVLSQLDALSYREIGGVLEVAPEKVKSLVFQARTTLASAREARDAPCFEIREQIATAHGSSLRRRVLRRHVHDCAGCQEFEAAVLRQRRDLEILLPVAPSAGLAQAVLGGVLGTSAGGVGGGLAATLGGLGLQTAAKLALVAVVASGGAAGAKAADLPERIHAAAPWAVGDEQAPAEHAGPTGGQGKGGLPGLPPGGDGSPGDRQDDGGAGPRGGAGSGERSGAPPSPSPAPETPGADSGGAVGGHGGASGGGGSSDLPPGLAKKDELPPGLAKRDELPPGLAKRDGEAPGKSGSAPGQGNGQVQGGSGNQGNGGGQGNAGGQGSPGNSGTAGGNGNANGNANGNGSAGGQGNGNAGGQGNAGGNGGAGGNGNGKGGGKP